MELTGKQRRQLRALGHHLDPAVQIGRGGITDSVVAALDTSLEAHELIKVRFGQGFEDDLAAAVSELARRTGSADAGRVGRTALLYRPREDDPRIVLN